MVADCSSKLGLGTLLFVVLLACDASRASAGWESVAPLPEPRWFHRAGVGPDGRLYIFGGYVVPPERGVRTLAKGEYALAIYDPERDAWSRGPAPPAFEYTIRAVNKSWDDPDGPPKTWEWETTVEKKVEYELPNGASGGSGDLYWFTIRGPVAFDPSASAWIQPEGPVWNRPERKYEGPVPRYDRGSAAMATDARGRIFFLGGVGHPVLKRERSGKHNLLRHAELYDPAENAWEEIAPMETPRQLFAACFGPEGRLYAFGGFGHEGRVHVEHDWSKAERDARIREMNRAGEQALSSVEAWDPETDTWEERAPMPLGVEGADCARGADGRIYVVGGTPSYSDPAPVRRVQVYDPRTDRWSEGPSLRKPRQGHAVVATEDGRIWAIGGTSRHSGFHPRMVLGGPPRAKGQRHRSVEVLDTSELEAPRRAPPSRG